MSTQPTENDFSNQYEKNKENIPEIIDTDPENIMLNNNNTSETYHSTNIQKERDPRQKKNHKNKLWMKFF